MYYDIDFKRDKFRWILLTSWMQMIKLSYFLKGFLAWLVATTFTVVLLLIKRWLTNKCNQLAQDNTIPANSHAIKVDDADATPQSLTNEDDDDEPNSHSSNPPSPINESQIPLLQYSHTPPSTSSNYNDDDDDLGIASRTRGKTTTTDL